MLRGISKAVGAMAGVLVLGACTGHSGSHGTTSAPRSQTSKPVSVQEYRTALANAVKPLDSALVRLNAATTYKGLASRVTAVDKAADQAATGLGRITPPAEVTAEHPRLITALRRFDDDLGTLGGKVGDHDLCTGPVVRAELGREADTAELRDAMKALLAKLPGEPLTLTLPGSGADATGRPANGHLIRSRGRGGRGTLTIDNGGSDDAVVTLARHGKPTISVYVRKDKKFTVTGVGDGTYTTFFTGGTAWDGRTRAFARGCSFQRFDDPLTFHTTVTGTAIRFSTWKITLEPVVGGNASTSDVDPDDFPAA